MQFAEMLKERGLSSGPVFATGILKGREAARMVADAKAQEAIRPMTMRILEQYEDPEVARLEKLEKAYNHFGYAERFGITFNDYVRKVDAGTWGDLADG